MVWQENSARIVMVTNLVEKGKVTGIIFLGRACDIIQR